MKHAWITEHRDSFPIALMCELLGVSRAGHYDSIDRPPSQRAERSARIRASVQQVFAESHAIYGPAKVAQSLEQREDLETACRNTVARAMRELGLKSRVASCRTIGAATSGVASRSSATGVLAGTAGASNRLRCGALFRADGEVEVAGKCEWLGWSSPLLW